MQVRATDLIADFPAPLVRGFLRAREFDLTAQLAITCLRINMEEAQRLLSNLECHGYIEKNPTKRETWQRTLKGGGMMRALFAKPITRPTAERKLKEFLDRVKNVNRSVVFAYKVKKVVLFGSMLGDRPRLGDIDLSVELVARETEELRQKQIEDSRRNLATDMRRFFPNYTAYMFWPCNEVMLFLKARSRSLQFTHPSDELLKRCEQKVIYQGDEKAD